MTTIVEIQVNKRGEVTIPFFRAGMREVSLHSLLRALGVC